MHLQRFSSLSAVPGFTKREGPPGPPFPPSVSECKNNFSVATNHWPVVPSKAPSNSLTIYNHYGHTGLDRQEKALQGEIVTALEGRCEWSKCVVLGGTIMGGSLEF